MTFTVKKLTFKQVFVAYDKRDTIDYYEARRNILSVSSSMNTRLFILYRTLVRIRKPCLISCSFRNQATGTLRGDTYCSDVWISL